MEQILDDMDGDDLKSKYDQGNPSGLEDQGGICDEVFFTHIGSH